jgi:hypothetical protein
MFSKYAAKLVGDERKRYFEKVSVINNVDPFTLSSSVLNADIPADRTTGPLLYNYLVLGTSAYTSDQFKSYRSLEAYNQCYSGRIKELAGCLIDGKFVVVGKVSCSVVYYLGKDALSRLMLAN